MHDACLCAFHACKCVCVHACVCVCVLTEYFPPRGEVSEETWQEVGWIQSKWRYVFTVLPALHNCLFCFQATVVHFQLILRLLAQERDRNWPVGQWKVVPVWTKRTKLEKQNKKRYSIQEKVLCKAVCMWGSMRPPCDLHVIPMWPSCDPHAILMWPTLYLPEEACSAGVCSWVPLRTLRHTHRPLWGPAGV